MADIRIALDLVSAQPIGVTGAGGHTTRSMTGRATLSWSSRTETQVLRVGYCDTTPMHVHIQGAREHNLRDVDVRFGDGHTVVTGVSGSGTTSLIFDTLYHEARQRFLEIFTLGSSRLRQLQYSVAPDRASADDDRLTSCGTGHSRSVPRGHLNPFKIVRAHHQSG
jgi:hypothetical protein